MKEHSPTSQELYQLTDPAGNIRPLVGTIEQIIEDLEWVAWKYSETDAGGGDVYIPPFEVKRCVLEHPGFPCFHYTWFTDQRPGQIADRATGYPEKLERLMFLAEVYTNDGETRTRLVDDPAPQGKVTGRLIPCPRNIDNVAAYAKLIIDTLNVIKGEPAEAVIETRRLMNNR